jgi:membrane protease YdiL (CAAX protease family)
MYLSQGYKGKLGIWKYFIIPIALIFVIVLNHLAVSLLGLDVNQIIENEIALKGKNRFLAEMLLQFAFLLIVLLLWVKYVHKQTLLSLTTSRKKIDWGRFWTGFGLIAIYIVITGAVSLYLNPEDYVLQFDLAPFIIMLVIVILLVPLQTSFEEYFFRGYLMQGIAIIAKNKWLPLVITSVVFGLMHIANPEVEKLGNIIMVYYIGTGFLLGIMTLMDEGLELALGFHAANNMITALLVTSDWSIFQTNSILKDISEPDMSLFIIIQVFVVYPIFLFILARKYKWTNWNEKLFGKVEKPIEIADDFQPENIDKLP